MRQPKDRIKYPELAFAFYNLRIMNLISISMFIQKEFAYFSNHFTQQQRGVLKRYRKGEPRFKVRDFPTLSRAMPYLRMV